MQKIKFHKNDNTEQKYEPYYITAHEYSMFNRRLLEHDKDVDVFIALKFLTLKS